MNENTFVALLNTLNEISVKGEDTKRMAACIDCVQKLIQEEVAKAAVMGESPAEPPIE